MASPIRARTYEAESAAAAARKFEADAAEAAEHGRNPASHVWEGSTLTVIYQSEDGTPHPDPAAVQPEPKPEEPTPEEPAKPEPTESPPSDVAHAYYGGKVPAATAAVETKRAAPATASVRASGEANPRRPTPFVTGKLAADTRPPTVKTTQAAPVDKTQANIGGGAIIVGGAMMVAGSFLPWLTASTGFATMSRGGMDGGDGILIVIAGGVAVGAGVASLMSGNFANSVVAGLAAVIGGFVGFIDFQDVQERLSGMGDNVIAEVGIGLWLIMAGAVVAVIGAVIAASAPRAS